MKDRSANFSLHAIAKTDLSWGIPSFRHADSQLSSRPSKRRWLGDHFINSFRKPRSLPKYCDGRHDWQAMAEVLRTASRQGLITVHRGEELITDLDAATTEKLLEGTFDTLARSALLVE